MDDARRAALVVVMTIGRRIAAPICGRSSSPSLHLRRRGVVRSEVSLEMEEIGSSETA